MSGLVGGSGWDGRPVVITVAPCGAEVMREQNPAIPYTPSEIADEVIKSVEAGAAAAHLHVRHEDGSPSSQIDDFIAVVESIRSRSDVITMVSTGGSVGMETQERMSGLEARPDFAGIETGSVNYGDEVFATTAPQTRQIAEAANEAGIQLEVEAFEISHIEAALRFNRQGLIQGPMRFNLVLGVPGGLSASPLNLQALVNALPDGAYWSVTAIGRHQWRMLALAVLLGADGVRVGLEDNIYLARGRLAESNAELVEKCVELIASLGRRHATCGEARRILDVRDRSG